MLSLSSASSDIEATTTESANSKSCSSYVDAVVAHLDLNGFIQSWNDGTGSIIPSYALLVVALSFEPERLQKFEAAFDDAAALGHETFEVDLQSRLEPVLFGSAMVAALTRCEGWAVDLASTDPAAVGILDPFANEQAFADWAVAQHPEPAELCGPYGEPILDTQVTEILLRRALGTITAAAKRTGWLVAPI
jgi:hypothetical protein